MSIYQKLKDVFHRKDSYASAQGTSGGPWIFKMDSATGPNAYQITMALKSDLKSFPMRNQYETGEGYLARLVTGIRGIEGETLTVERTKNGILNDGPNGEPAFQQYKDGKVTAAESYKNGKKVPFATKSKPQKPHTP